MPSSSLARRSPLPAHPARRALRWLALAVLAVSIGFWAAKGARLGWSQNQVPVQGVDEITGLDYVRYEQRFVPGIEWVGGAAGLAAALFALSFLFRSNSSLRTP